MTARGRQATLSLELAPHSPGQPGRWVITPPWLSKGTPGFFFLREMMHAGRVMVFIDGSNVYHALKVTFGSGKYDVIKPGLELAVGQKQKTKGLTWPTLLEMRPMLPRARRGSRRATRPTSARSTSLRRHSVPGSTCTTSSAIRRPCTDGRLRRSSLPCSRQRGPHNRCSRAPCPISGDIRVLPRPRFLILGQMREGDSTESPCSTRPWLRLATRCRTPTHFSHARNPTEGSHSKTD